jgi:hypothetical protein
MWTKVAYKNNMELEWDQSRLIFKIRDHYVLKGDLIPPNSHFDSLIWKFPSRRHVSNHKCFVDFHVQITQK